MSNTLDSNLKALIATYTGFLKHKEFKAIAEESLVFVKQHGISKILVDTRKTKIIKLESQQWINTTWFPRAERAGVTHMAFLIPKDYFGKISVEATNKPAEQRGKIAIQYFTTMEEAKQWLQSQTVNSPS